jgi:hypothetical protein
MRIGHLPEKSKGEARLVEPQIGVNGSFWQDRDFSDGSYG